MLTRSIGVAFEVPGQAREWLHDLRVRLDDPDAHRMPPHVTLLPPTRVPDERFVDVLLHLEGVGKATCPITVRLAGAATFRPVTPTVYVPLVEGDDSVTTLAAQVRSGPLHRELSLPYHAHATVAYELPDEVLDAAMEELRDFDHVFEVTAFTLYEADASDVWQPAYQFGLSGST